MSEILTRTTYVVEETYLGPSWFTRYEVNTHEKAKEFLDMLRKMGPKYKYRIVRLTVSEELLSD